MRSETARVAAKAKMRAKGLARAKGIAIESSLPVAPGAEGRGGAPFPPLGPCETPGRGQKEHALPSRCSNTRPAERRYRVVGGIRPPQSPIGVRLARRL